jgi:putative flippase GtrA
MERLSRLILALLRSHVVRVAAVGAVGVVVQTLIFEILAFGLGVLRPSVAVLVGAEFGILTNFFLNHHLNFRGAADAHLLARLARFHLVVSGSLFIQWVCVYSAETFMDSVWAIRGAYATGILLGFISNYTLYRLWVWRHHSPPDA